jgi:hypothetical protein
MKLSSSDKGWSDKPRGRKMEEAMPSRSNANETDVYGGGLPNASKSFVHRQVLKGMIRPEVWQPLLVVALLSLVQQFSGMSMLRAYVVTIFNGVFSSEHPMKENLECSNGDDGVTSSEAYYSAMAVATVRLFARFGYYFLSFVFLSHNFIIVHLLQLDIVQIALSLQKTNAVLHLGHIDLVVSMQLRHHRSSHLNH